MKITNTVMIKSASAETATAKYQLEYTISNGSLQRVMASIYETSREQGNDVYIGNIVYDNGTMNCSLPMGSKASVFFDEFEAFMIKIKADSGKC